MTTPQPAIVGTVPAPFGPYTAAFTARGLAKLAFANEPPDACRAFLRRWEPDAPLTEGLGPHDDTRLAQLSDELNAYFAGDLRTFRTRLDPRGTPFQRLVYHGLLGIPF